MLINGKPRARKARDTREWLLEYGRTCVVNSNYLTDHACPQCGNRECFHIVGSAIFEVIDNGSSDFIEMEWEPSAMCTCRECGALGRVREFTFPGLDARLLAAS